MSTPAVPANGTAERLPPHAYFLLSAVFHYLGPAFAVLLFVRVDVLGVAWLRIASAAVIFALWRRPWRAWGRLDRRTKQLLLVWGTVLAVMNNCFYLAIDRLPLGTVAAIEFLPVIVLAAVAARTRRNVLALVLAVTGVFGVMSHTVAERTREIGIRMALGAQPGDVLRQIVGRTLALASAGLVIGLVGAFAVGRVLQSQLFGVQLVDPPTLIVV